MKFGCSVMNYLIDQGVRLEVRMRDSEGMVWYPVRYYAVNLTQPTDYSSLVTLNPDHISVTAVAVTYSSSIPLKVVDEGLDHTITEYLCGTFLDSILTPLMS